MLTKLNYMRKEREDGFTLIELLVVVLIIGILAAIAIPVFLNQQKTANDASVEADLRNAATLAETWKVDNPNTPISKASFAGLKGSSGVNIKLTIPVRTDGTFKLCGYHKNGNTKNAGSAYVYDSAAGGLQTTREQCNSAVDGDSAYLTLLTLSGNPV